MCSSALTRRPKSGIRSGHRTDQQILYSVTFAFDSSDLGLWVMGSDG